MQDGIKNDDGKVHLYKVLFKQFPLALQRVAKCSEVGHKKYPSDSDWNNYARISDPSRYLDAGVRHLFQSEGSSKKLNEEDSKYGEIYHLDQVVWNFLAYLEIQLRMEKEAELQSDKEKDQNDLVSFKSLVDQGLFNESTTLEGLIDLVLDQKKNGILQDLLYEIVENCVEYSIADLHHPGIFKRIKEIYIAYTKFEKKLK